MQGARSLGQFLTAALALAPLASAWPSWLPDVDALVVRQDDGSSSSRPTPTSTEARQSRPTSESTSNLNLNTGRVSPTSNDGNPTATGNSTSQTTHRTFNAMDPPGGVNMLTPAPIAGSTLYRIGDPTPITWVWNYTSLQGTPSGINVLVSCSAASATWTLTQNMTFEPTATFTWDTLKYSQSAVASPLLVEQYTLLIHDAESSVDAVAEAGYLAPFNNYRFALYTARPYQDLDEWKCATCSGALGDLDRQALSFAISMTLITIFSFTWYVTGFAGLL
ncbi:hypothetical protein GGS23DRAFT_568492 [Durotheca rogersii]|uniref:uncharacterized protein n=1 Tax=Durotheca rogersii TaxID=419775 RepID=UPI00221F2092|nr:uncharacterized protein GGS23DRAFT_568492 [Durotheca rogersii]KAI5863155.1 hypothetical protein GGS23DRAFT_568492 [Durotheca rogersii]